MISFTLKGLLTRKLRTALTAIAIILGVATVTGTFVLTDSIDKAFNSIFTDVYQNTDATITPESPFDTGDSGATEASVRRVVAGEGQGSARRQGSDRGRGERQHAVHQGREGDRLRRRPEPRLLGRPVQPQFNRLSLVQGAGRERTRSWSTSPPRTRRISPRPDDRRPGRGPRRDDEDLRVRQVRLRRARSAAQRSPGSTLRTAQRLFGKDGKLDQIRVAAKSGVSPTKLIDPDQNDPAAAHRGPHRHRAGARGREGHRRVHLVPPLFPAGLRADRLVRRRVRDRQLALDHDRPAHARARDPPHPRRLASPGAALRRARGRRDGRARLDRRPVPRARAREGPLLPLRRGRLHAAEQRDSPRDEDRDRSRFCSESSSR